MRALCLRCLCWMLGQQGLAVFCPSPAEWPHSWHLNLPCPPWRTKERAAWGDPSPDPIGTASCWLLLQPASNKPDSRVLLALISFIPHLSVYASPSFVNAYLPSHVQGLECEAQGPHSPCTGGPDSPDHQWRRWNLCSFTRPGVTKVRKPHLCTGSQGSMALALSSGVFKVPQGLARSDHFSIASSPPPHTPPHSPSHSSQHFFSPHPCPGPTRPHPSTPRPLLRSLSRPPRRGPSCSHSVLEAP